MNTKFLFSLATVCSLFVVTNPVFGQSTNVTLSVKWMIDDVNVKGGNDEIDHRSAKDLGLADKTYPCKEIDVTLGNDQRGIMAATIDGQDYLFFVHLRPSDAWMFRISKAGEMEKGIYGLNNEGFKNVTNEKQTLSEFTAESKFWSDWLTARPNLPRGSTNAPATKP